MTTYILILWIWGGNADGIAMREFEFSSAAACQSAKASAKSEGKLWGPYVSGVCVPK